MIAVTNGAIPIQSEHFPAQLNYFLAPLISHVILRERQVEVRKKSSEIFGTHTRQVAASNARSQSRAKATVSLWLEQRFT
jgi:hypothetical protein